MSCHSIDLSWTPCEFRLHCCNPANWEKGNMKPTWLPKRTAHWWGIRHALILLKEVVGIGKKPSLVPDIYDDEGNRTKRTRHQKQNEPVKGMLLKEFSCLIFSKSDGSSIYKSVAHNFCKAFMENAFFGQSFTQKKGHVEVQGHFDHKRMSWNAQCAQIIFLVSFRNLRSLIAYQLKMKQINNIHSLNDFW